MKRNNLKVSLDIVLKESATPKHFVNINVFNGTNKLTYVYVIVVSVK